MFGYVNAYKNELKVKDYDTYRAYYCGVCFSLKKNMSFLSRFGLSYDITFMAIVLDSLNNNRIKAEKKICMAHPLKKRAVVTENEAIDYSAQVGVILTYLKFKDDLHDDKSIKALLGMICFWSAVRKAAKKLPGIYKTIKSLLGELSGLEKENCQNPDAVADIFGKILAHCMMADFVDEGQKRQLYEMGYQLGRWIYLIDAVNDIENDIKDKKYNPFKNAYNNKKELAKGYELPLTLTLDAIGKAYQLTDIGKNSDLIENIIYLGLLKKQTEILEGTDENGSI